MLFTLVNFTVLMYFVTQTRRIETDFKQHITKKCHQCHQATEYLHHITRTQLRNSENTSSVSVGGIDDLFLQPVIYVITPTYRRGTQQPDLTRLSQTLMNVRKLHWIVVEDSATRSQFVADLLKRSGLDYTHLNVSTPTEERKSKVKCLAFICHYFSQSYQAKHYTHAVLKLQRHTGKKGAEYGKPVTLDMYHNGLFYFCDIS